MGLLECIVHLHISYRAQTHSKVSPVHIEIRPRVSTQKCQLCNAKCKTLFLQLPPLTCSSPFLLFSTTCCCFSFFFLWPVYEKFWALTVISLWCVRSRCWFFFASPSHWLRQHRCALSAIPPPSSSLRLVVLSRSLPLATAAWLVWHQCFLLTSPLWLAVIYLCRVHRAFMRSLSARTEDGDPSAVLDKQNVCMYSMDCDDPSFLVACIFHCSMKSFLWTPFPSRLPLCYFTKTRNHGSSPTSSGKKNKNMLQGLFCFLTVIVTTPTLSLVSGSPMVLERSSVCLVPRLSVAVLLWPVSLFGHSDLDRDFWNNNDSSTVQQRWSSYPPKEFVLNISPYAPYGDPRLTLKWVLVQGW